MPGHPPEADVVRELILAEIRDSFRGVTRIGGVSWSESEVIEIPVRTVGARKDFSTAVLIPSQIVFLISSSP